MSTIEPINAATDALHQLRRLESMKKLCADSFRKEALAVAGLQASDIPALESKLAAADVGHVHSMIRTMMRRMKEASWSRPFPASKAARALHVFGSAEAGRQIAALNMTVAQVQAIAVCRLVENDAD